MSRRLQEIFPIELVPPELRHLPIVGLAYTIAAVRPGVVFAAWQGSKADGHQYIEQAVRQGACLILAERPIPCAVAQIVIPNLRQVYAEAVWRWYDHPDRDLQLAGITGTNGKTTTTHMLAAIWAAAGIATGHVGTLGFFDGTSYQPNPWTTPDAEHLAHMFLHMRTNKTKAAVLEMSSQALAQDRVRGMQLDIAAFLNLSQDHLDAHGTMEAYAAAKKQLLTYLKPNGIAVINRDCATFGPMQYPRSIGFSTKIMSSPPQEGAIQCCLAAPPTFDNNGITCLVWAGGSAPIALQTPLMGQFQVENILASVACAQALQLPAAACQAGLVGMQPIAGRLQLVSKPPQPMVWVDYAHTPVALAQVLQSIRPWIKGRLVVIIGCGGDRDKTKRAPMALAAAEHADVCVLTSDNPRTEDPKQILHTMELALQQRNLRRVERLLEQPGYGCWLEREQAIANTIGQLAPEDGLLIAGKGHETYQLIGTQRLPFDDRLVAAQALAGYQPPISTHA